MASTHFVTNPVPDLVDTDLAADPPLLEAVAREGAGWSLEALHDTGPGQHAVVESGQRQSKTTTPRMFLPACMSS